MVIRHGLNIKCIPIFMQETLYEFWKPFHWQPLHPLVALSTRLSFVKLIHKSKISFILVGALIRLSACLTLGFGDESLRSSTTAPPSHVPKPFCLSVMHFLPKYNVFIHLYGGLRALHQPFKYAVYQAAEKSGMAYFGSQKSESKPFGRRKLGKLKRNK